MPAGALLTTVPPTLEPKAVFEAATSVPPRPANAAGIWRFALLVDDLDAACTELTEHTNSAYSHPVALDMGPGLPPVRFVCFAGPDGEVIELIEAPRDGG